MSEPAVDLGTCPLDKVPRPSCPTLDRRLALTGFFSFSVHHLALLCHKGGTFGAPKPFGDREHSEIGDGIASPLIGLPSRFDPAFFEFVVQWGPK